MVCRLLFATLEEAFEKGFFFAVEAEKPVGEENDAAENASFGNEERPIVGFEHLAEHNSERGYGHNGNAEFEECLAEELGDVDVKLLSEDYVHANGAKQVSRANGDGHAHGAKHLGQREGDGDVGGGHYHKHVGLVFHFVGQNHARQGDFLREVHHRGEDDEQDAPVGF